MARPRTPIGTYGTIKVIQVDEDPDVFEARARFRMADGRMLRPRARGRSKTAARNALTAKMSKLATEVTGKSISGDTSISHIAELWLAELKRKVDDGARAPKTYYDYRDTVRNHITTRLGKLAAREASVTAWDSAIKAVRDETGYSSAKRMKVVGAGICGYAVRHGAMTINPIRHVDTLERGERPPIRALEPAQRRVFLTELRAWVDQRVRKEKYDLGPRARSWTDLPDIAEGMLATGTRIGEMLAVIGDGVDPVRRTVVVDHHLVRIEGEGIVRAPLRKGDNEGLTLKIPTWAVPVFRRRKLESGGGALFPAWNGAWVDPSNVTKRLRTACDGIGYGWVSSHVFRKTVGTHLGDQDVAPTAIGDQLGNTAAVVEKHYRRKRIANADVADKLESLLDEDAG